MLININCAIIIIIILLLYCECSKYGVRTFFTTTKVKSPADGNEYRVLVDYDDKQRAAELIGQVNLFTKKLVDQMRADYIDMTEEEYIHKYRGNSLEYAKGREVTEILMDRYSPSSLMENEPESPDKTAFTRDKGRVISLCLREKTSGKNNFHSLDMILFVMLHELAHVITPEINHSDRFWVNFKFLLEYAQQRGLYFSPDYGESHEEYCSTKVEYNPVYDRGLYSYFS